MKAIEEWLSGPAATKLIGIATLVVAVSMMVLAALTVPGLVADTAANRRTDDLGACRDEARSGIDDADVDLATATARVQALVAVGLSAAVAEDVESLQQVIGQIQAATDQVDDAIDDLTEAADRYAAAVTLSREDPDRFLALCETNP